MWANYEIPRPRFNPPKQKVLYVECEVCFAPRVYVDKRMAYQRRSCENCFTPHELIIRGRRIGKKANINGRRFTSKELENR